MLGWAIGFFVAAIIAAVFGFGGVATAFMGIAQLLFYIFVALFAIALIASFFVRPAAHIGDDVAHTGRHGGFSGFGAIAAVLMIGLGVYLWMDNDMSAERLGRMIDRSATNITADASEAIGEAGDRAETLVSDTTDGVRSDTANLLDDASDNVRETRN